MSFERGTVLGIDRENGTVRAEVGGVIVPEAPYLGDPPWPLSAAWFFNAPAYTCLGPIGTRRWAFQDDFNFYDSTPPVVSGGWTANGDAGGSLSTPNNPTDGNGVLRLTNTTAGGPGYFVRKTLEMVTLADTRVYWLSARVRTSDASNGIDVGLGVSNVMLGGAPAATDAQVAASLMSASGTNVLYTTAGTSTSTLSTGEFTVNNTWLWVDVMVAGGQWAAMWVDGSGPWSTTTDVPSTAQDSVTPYLLVSNRGASTRLDIDYASMATVDLTTTADPTTFGFATDAVDDVLT